MDQLARQQQEKDFLLTQQKASFHEQLVKIQTEFEAKKSVIEEEKKHIQQETEKQVFKLAFLEICLKGPRCKGKENDILMHVFFAVTTDERKSAKARTRTATQTTSH